jgi:hypothetical protein
MRTTALGIERTEDGAFVQFRTIDNGVIDFDGKEVTHDDEPVWKMDDPCPECGKQCSWEYREQLERDDWHHEYGHTTVRAGFYDVHRCKCGFIEYQTGEDDDLELFEFGGKKFERYLSGWTRVKK